MSVCTDEEWARDPLGCELRNLDAYYTSIANRSAQAALESARNAQRAANSTQAVGLATLAVANIRTVIDGRDAEEQSIISRWVGQFGNNVGAAVEKAKEVAYAGGLDEAGTDALKFLSSQGDVLAKGALLFGIGYGTLAIAAVAVGGLVLYGVVFRK